MLLFARQRVSRSGRALGGASVFALLLFAVAHARAEAAAPALFPTTVRQGGLVRVFYAIPSGKMFEKASLVFGTSTARCYPRQEGLVGLLGISARTATGTHTVTLWVRYQDGTHEKHILPVRVVSGGFPTQHIRMPAAKTGLMSKAILEKEWQILAGAMDESAAEPLWEGTFASPLEGRISSPFGRKRYVNGRFWGFHSGLDVASPAGKPVKAANHGRVVLAQKLWMRGNTVMVDHGLGVFTLYEHLSRLSVSVGQEVRKGDVVGAVGSTGFSTGPHLHWEMRVHGVPTNPADPMREGIPLRL